jgi:outer membrane protein OmpA-like peptidoglycan-associated protein
MVFAQQDNDQNRGGDRQQNKEQRQEKRQEQRQEKRQERQEQRQERQQQQPQERSRPQQQQQERPQQPQQQRQPESQRERPQPPQQRQPEPQRERPQPPQSQPQDQKPRQQQEQRENRQERREDRRDSREERRDNREDRRGDRQDSRQDQRNDRRDEKQDNRQDRRDDRKDSRQERREDRQDSRQDRREDKPDARRLEDIRGERRERRDGNRTIIQEGSRTIVRDGDRTFIRREEGERFRRIGRDVNVQRVGNETRTVVIAPNGQRIVTVTDANGRLLRRSRYVNNREVVIIDNRPRGGRRADSFFVSLPALAIGTLGIPRDRYIVEADGAPPEYIYDALLAPPVAPLPRAYTLDEIRYSADVRDRMPRIDLDTITFDTGSWDVAPDQYSRLAPIAEGIRRAVERNPNEVFLIEGHTDAVGTDEDNLSLSDRRAETVAVILTDEFKIPPENLTTQGYGEQQLKVPSEGAERANRRVTVRRITPLLQQGQATGPEAPRR